MAKKRRTEKRRTGSGKMADRLVMIGSILLSVVLIVVMILNAPIIDYRTLTNGTMTNQQISIMKYFKVWQPLVQKEGTLQKPAVTDASALNLKEDVEAQDPKDDGLDLQQIVEGQYTVLFMGMDESGKLADVNWIFQFDLFAGTMNVLQIPRDCYMPDYANPSTNKFNSIYGSGQEEGVTSIQRAVNAIQESFGLTIDCYVKLVCTDIANIVDSIGGIPITLPEEIMYEADKVLKAGEQTLNGQQAEWFVRFRREYDEGDIGRVKAQRIFLAAAMEKLLDMSQTELMSAMQKIYKNEWIATDLSLEQISMLADFASERLTMESVNVYMIPGEGLMYEEQSVYSIHKTEAIDLINAHFRPYQNEMYYDESTIVELVEESEYEDTYSDTEENLSDIHNGDTEDGRQNIYSRDDEE
ncbi:MAG: LCP family protein [Oscillospiraceae bacterium]|nr:LCP family protein [Oscillospiraceae bacterium]MDD7294506.1 LCP family protein [Oscillospiraceae bacterium]MDY2509209.1 LCP family protein [Ruminococcus callidus]